MGDPEEQWLLCSREPKVSRSFGSQGSRKILPTSCQEAADGGKFCILKTTKNIFNVKERQLGLEEGKGTLNKPSWATRLAQHRCSWPCQDGLTLTLRNRCMGCGVCPCPCLGGSRWGLWNGDEVPLKHRLGFVSVPAVYPSSVFFTYLCSVETWVNDGPLSSGYEHSTKNRDVHHGAHFYALGPAHPTGEADCSEGVWMFQPCFIG